MVRYIVNGTKRVRSTYTLYIITAVGRQFWHAPRRKQLHYMDSQIKQHKLEIAFDNVNHCKLFLKLLQDNVDVNVVSLMAFRYANQQLCVRWMSTLSRFFTTTNGTRQGSILSPYLFSRYIRELLYEVVQSRCGCCIGDMMLNVLAQANDRLQCSWRHLGEQFRTCCICSISLVQMLTRLVV